MNKYFKAVFLIGIFIICTVQCQFSGLAGMSPADNALLDSAIKQIVHPRASPTASMRNIAMIHGGPPSTTTDMMDYLPHMQNLARQMGVKPPGVTGSNVDAALNRYIQQRAFQWLQQYNMRRGGNLFGNMGNWLMRMMFFENFF